MRNAAMVAIVVLLAAGARAEEPADAKAQAKLHFKLGLTYYGAGDYKHAIDEYQTAYRLLPLPDFLFNVAQAYRLEGDRARALQFYARYLLVDPDGRGADEARQHMQELKAQEAAAAKPTPPKPATPTPKPVEKPAIAIVVKPTTPPPAPTVVEPKPIAPANPILLAAAPPPPAKRTPLYKKWWLWTAVGVAAVGVGVGLGVGLGGSSRAAAFHTDTFTVKLP